METGVTASIEALTEQKCGHVWKMPPCFVHATFQSGFWKFLVPLLRSGAFSPPRLLGCRTAPEGLDSVADCLCTSCFWLKEYVMRASRRGNGPMDTQGSGGIELLQSMRDKGRGK